ncbi:TatD family hydrolase [Acidithiobacillus ferrivorans]|uniref:TatD family hydrolase n=1 Tax=Acidithiobacillus ferrivorans TaxID=160808 RepID=A0A7T4WFI7_9PROT|nr:TatD family hydrolase [Acidithiobacillus ferrivorans]QQD73505.1 TatD family hydrolase [Acidithiobacillus ferrivorans]
MYGLIDSHCHLDDVSFDEDRDAILRRAEMAGVCKIIVPAYTPKHWCRLKETCRHHPGLYPAYGVHPLYLDDRDDRWEATLATHLTQAVALGEIGLDASDGAPDAARQQAVFTIQLAMAQQLGLPVILHARQSLEEVILILRRFPGLRGVLHSFSGSLVQAQRLMDLGFLLGLGGALTHPRAQRLRATVANLPVESLLAETDAPWQTPHGHPGIRNEPAYLSEIIASLAQLRHTPAQEIAQVTAQNALTLFHLQDAP